MIKTVCVVCGLPDGPPDGEVVETVCGDSDCISLFECLVIGPFEMRDGGRPRESMQTALEMMAETHAQMIAERGEA